MKKSNVPFILAALAVAAFLVAAISTARGASPQATQTVQVVYLSPDDVKDAQAARAALDEAQASYDAIVARVAAQYAQEDVPPVSTSGLVLSNYVSFGGGYWQNSGPQPPSPAGGKRWLDGFAWGFRFLSDYSGIIPATPPASSEEKSATIQLFKR